MRRLYLLVLVFVAFVSNATAQTYNMKLEKKDGTVITIPADEVKQVTFVEAGQDPNPTIIDNEEEIMARFARCYRNFSAYSVSGGDVMQDEYQSDFVRQLFNLNELPTDEVLCGWGDQGFASLCYGTFDATNPFIQYLFSKLYTGIAICNAYLDIASDYNQTMTAEVRFLRALNYFYLLDGWGNVPIVTSAFVLDMPAQSTRQELYTFVEAELLAAESSLDNPQYRNAYDEKYGRVDKAAAWLLLSRLYLNAEVYTGTAQWQKAANYAEMVINSSYQLYTYSQNGWTAYQQLFMGDNGQNGASSEAIFPILFDSTIYPTYSGTTFLTACCFDDDVVVREEWVGNGTTQLWAGYRARPTLIQAFFPNNNAPNVHVYEMASSAGDDRALFDGFGRNLHTEIFTDFKNGFAIGKFHNFYVTGMGYTPQFSDADFFLFRSAEAYLNYAEATARQNGGTATTQGKSYLNLLRTRAHASTLSTYSLDDILSEWSREFYLEGRRRMDLIRFGRFGGSSSYTWEWKGGSYNGTSFPAYRNLFPIPASELAMNPYLVQNPGY